MATSESKPTDDATHYHEDDKLGPLGAKVTALYDPVALRKALLGEFHAAVAKAKAAATSDTLATAVHESRKALRRGRAVLSMISAALPKSERRAVLRALQEARRSLSIARDHAVAPVTMTALALSEEDRVTAKRVLDNAAEARPSAAELAHLLADVANRAAAQAEALEAALPQHLSWSEVVTGVQQVYGEARKARAKSKKSTQQFHSWRRRSKELVYQLELLAEHAGQRISAIRDEVSGIVDQLSPAVDLIMLHEFVRTYAQGIASESIDHLAATIEYHVAELMKSTRSAGRDTFEEKPKKFGKRLVKSAKRDLTPPDDSDLNALD